MFLPNTSMYNI